MFLQTIIQRRREVTDMRVSTEMSEWVVAREVFLLRVDKPRRRRCSASVPGVMLPALVFDRRRPCTTPCIFGNAAFRAASMNLTRADVRGEVGGDLDNGLSVDSEADGEVILSEGRISWNVMGALPGLMDGL
jgi:hypothetical protein